ncbi:hypothetical protein BCR34DRAFT_557534 [Clohesyomyces aquaticus]|uniref:Uncharacterized protein n=1 Tax=Clohesyomyces aquaticus TaxID=1231657 RepID=A0A1Y2A190_9PLEO|nr:hypothetical protein BCR34DRAFT_557534 [Clohesyomyces aquaticus]
MAPPHLTKKSTKTSEQIVQRNGHREHRKRVIEEVDEEDDDEIEMLDADEHSEPALPGDSQDTTASAGAAADTISVLLNDMKEDQLKRHEVRKSKVKKSFFKSVTETQGAVTTLFANHESEAAPIHSAQLSRLQDLLNQKAELEVKMQDRVSALQTLYLGNSGNMVKVAEARIRQLS